MPTTTPKTDRFSNRAPKGGAVSPVNGQFYKGGQFMPMVSVSTRTRTRVKTNAEQVIRELLKVGEVEPTEARQAAVVPAVEFNATVRLLKRMGSLVVTEAGLLAAW